MSRPQLVPSPLGWLGLPASRRMRVSAEDGALIVTEADGRRRVLTDLTRISRIVQLPSPAEAGLRPRRRTPLRRYADRHGSPVPWPVDGDVAIAMLAGELPVAAFWVDEWWPGTAGVSTVEDALEVTGMAAIARAAGGEVEPASVDDVTALRRHGDALRRSVVSPLPRLRPWHLVLAALTYLGWVATFAAALVLIGVDGEPVLPLLVPGMAAATIALIAAGVVGERRAGRLAREYPESGDIIPLVRAELHTVDPGLAVAADHIVVRDGQGREAWLPGNTRDGVRTAEVDAGGVVLRDADGRVWAAAGGPEWSGSGEDVDRSRTLFARAGYNVSPSTSTRSGHHAMHFWTTRLPSSDAFPLFGVKEATGLHTMQPHQIATWSLGPALVATVSQPDHPLVAVSAVAMVGIAAATWARRVVRSRTRGHGADERAGQ